MISARKGVHNRSIQQSKLLFFEEGFSEYKIVKKKGFSQVDAVRELNDFIHLATGYYLDVIYDEILVYSEESKYIVVGDTTITPSDMLATNLSELKTSGYKIKTIGKSIFINGATQKAVLFGVYDLLGVLFNFDFFAENEYALDKVQNLTLPILDVTEIPDFQYREGTYGNIVREDKLLDRFRFTATKDMYVFGHTCHNTFLVLPPSQYFQEHPDWYVLNQFGEPAQICWSNEELRKEYIKNVKAYLEKKPNAIMLMGMEDNHLWCECEKCRAIENKYGKKSVAAIYFANHVVEEINAPRKAEGKEPYKFLIFAYYATNDAPVVVDEKSGEYRAIDETVKFHKDLGVFYAPGGAWFTHHFDTAESNVHYYEQLKRWNALTKTVHLWVYPLFAFHHMVPYPFARAMQHNYKVWSVSNVRSLFDQTQHEQCNYSTFCHLHAYLQSKMEWNVDEDIDALTDKFFKYYFKDVAAPMRKYYDSILQWYDYIFENTDARGSWGTNLMDKQYFSEEVLNEWKSFVQEAYDLVAKVENRGLALRLKERIRVEELSLDYLRMEIYGENWEESILEQERLRFYEDFTALGLQRVNEIERIKDTVWKRWDIEKLKNR